QGRAAAGGGCPWRRKRVKRGPREAEHGAAGAPGAPGPARPPAATTWLHRVVGNGACDDVSGRDAGTVDLATSSGASVNTHLRRSTRQPTLRHVGPAPQPAAARTRLDVAGSLGDGDNVSLTVTKSDSCSRVGQG